MRAAPGTLFGLPVPSRRTGHRRPLRVQAPHKRQLILTTTLRGRFKDEETGHGEERTRPRPQGSSGKNRSETGSLRLEGSDLVKVY